MQTTQSHQQASDAGREELRQRAQRIVEAARVPGALDRLTDADKATVAQALKEAHQYIRVPRLHALFPDTGPLRRELYPKHMEHFWAGKKYKARAFRAGNRIGKTWAGGYEVGCHATGWYPHWWNGWRIDHPGEHLVAAKLTKTIKKVPQPCLFGPTDRSEKGTYRVRGTGMIPADKIVHKSAMFMTGAPGTLDNIQVRYKDSLVETSTISFLSYEMKRRVFEGFAADLAWLDEECPIDIFAEVAKRTMTTQGRMVLTWTPLDGLTEVVLAFMEKDYKPPEVPAFDTDQLVPAIDYL